MAGIRLSELGEAIAYQSVPWADNPISIKKESFPKGKVPDHLSQYLFEDGGVPDECANETEGLSGATRVTAMNACVSKNK